MLAQEMVDRAVSVRQVATQLGVDESTLRYRLRRPLDAPDGRSERCGDRAAVRPAVTGGRSLGASHGAVRDAAR